MSEHKAKVGLIEDAETQNEVARVDAEWRAKSGQQQDVIQFSDRAHFSDGHLNRKTKEAIASWVSWLNRCPY